MERNRSRSMTALRRVTLAILGMSPDPTDETLKGLSQEEVVRLAAFELLPEAKVEGEFSAMLDGIVLLLTEAASAAPKAAFDEWVWARLLGEYRCRLTKSAADLQASEDDRRRQGVRISYLQGLVADCLPFLETSDANGAARLFSRAQALLRSHT